MKDNLYFRLGRDNILKNKMSFFPYIFMMIGNIAIYFMISYMSKTLVLDHVRGGGSVIRILDLSLYIVFFFLIIMIFYTNRYLMKQHKRDLGIYCILGMEKMQVAKVLLYETLICGVVSIVAGIMIGFVLSKLSTIVLAKMMNVDNLVVKSYPLMDLLLALFAFAIPYILVCLYNCYQIKKLQTITLLHSDKEGETEPKAKVFPVIAGVVTVLTGYTILCTCKSPIKGIPLFAVAVVCIMIGTYLLFQSGSIALLKWIKNRKDAYYKTHNFIAVSGLIYRMKQNATGLANICLLSTAVLVIVASTCCVYTGLEDALRNTYEHDIVVRVDEVNGEDIDTLKNMTKNVLEDNDISKDDICFQAVYWENVFVNGKNGFEGKERFSADENMVDLLFMDADSYYDMSGEEMALEESEAAVYSVSGKIDSSTITVQGIDLTIKEHLDTICFYGEDYEALMDSYIIIVNNVKTIERIQQNYETSTKEPTVGKFTYQCSIDVSKSYSDARQIAAIENLNQQLKDYNPDIHGIANEREGFYTRYGSLLFVGIFLGVIFLAATVLIIYYKQVTEGMEDREKFTIMSKLGVEDKELKAAIKSQILIVFFMPVVIAGIHMFITLPCISKIMILFGLVNKKVFVLTFVVIFILFVLIYLLIYRVTSHQYYHIVKDTME